MAARYKEDGIKYPNRVIVGSETSPPETAKTWGLVETCEHVIGDFTWTGWDYIGEAGIGIASYQLGEGGMGASYPCQLAYCGDIDITGFRRPASYFREIIFGLRKNPYITVQDPDKYGAKLLKTPWSLSDSIPSWTWEDCEGKNVIIEVYAPGEEVEVLCNGKSLGRKAAGKVVGYITYFKTIYEPGTLTAISYENQTEIGRTDLATTDAECNLVILPEEENTTELIYVPMEIHDKYGNIVMDKDVKLEITAEGGADIIGFGSGNPKPIYNYTERITETFHGRALAVLKKNGKVSTVTITVSSDKYPEVTTTLHI